MPAGNRRHRAVSQPGDDLDMGKAHCGEQQVRDNRGPRKLPYPAAGGRDLSGLIVHVRASA